MSQTTSLLLEALEKLPAYRLFGRVAGIVGTTIEVAGLEQVLAIGSRCAIASREGQRVTGEVIGFRAGHALLLPYGGLEGVGLGSKVEYLDEPPMVYPSDAWLGRVVNALGQPLDGKGPLLGGPRGYPLQTAAPPANRRARVGGKINLGVRALNALITCCKGQRMGIFSGSGVGKSILLSMLARYTAADVTVIGLIGERGREVQEWLQDELGPDGLARCVVVVATSDEVALMRRQAAYLTLSIAESFRDRGRSVLCLMDSVTRFAMALREIGLAAGEPPASKGYTPSVFGELPRLLERAGPGTGVGSITGLFTVLVEGDDHNEPISDAVRGILDGHVVLDRRIAERNRYPAINILRSISRTMPACNGDLENQLVGRAKALLSTYEDMAELIRIGAYRQGSDAAVDEAVHYYPRLEAFLAQSNNESIGIEASYAELAAALDVDWQAAKSEAAIAEDAVVQDADAGDADAGDAGPETGPAIVEAAGLRVARPTDADVRAPDDRTRQLMEEARELTPE